MSTTVPTHLLSVQVIWWEEQIMNAGLTRLWQVHYTKLNAIFRKVLRWENDTKVDSKAVRSGV